MPWWGWTVLAAGIGLAELHVAGSYLIWIALGAAMTAALTAIGGLSISAQVGAFIVASAFSCCAGFFVYRRFDRNGLDGAALNQRGLLTVGARGVVVTDLASGDGKVRLGDTVWLAEGPDLVAGTPVIVRSVRGSRVVVDPVVPAAARQ
jgi:inner membrane protein